MCTVRNAFDLIYKGKLISYYVYGQVSSSKKTLRLCDIIYEKLYFFLRTSVCTKENTGRKRRELWFTHTTYAVTTDTETYLPCECGLFHTAYFQNGPTVDLMKRFHQYYDGQRDRRVPVTRQLIYCFTQNSWPYIVQNWCRKVTFILLPTR